MLYISSSYPSVARMNANQSHIHILRGNNQPVYFLHITNISSEKSQRIHINRFDFHDDDDDVFIYKTCVDHLFMRGRPPINI